MVHPTTMKGAPKRKGLTPGQRKAYKRLKAAAETSEEAQAAKVHMMLSPVEMPLIKKKRKAKPKVHTAAARRRERERHKQMCMHAPPAPTASSIASPTLTFATNTTPAEAVGPVGSTAPLDAIVGSTAPLDATKWPAGSADASIAQGRARRVGLVHPDIDRLCGVIRSAKHLKVLGGDVQRRHIRGERRRDGHTGFALSASIPAASINAASMTELLGVLLETDNDIQYMNMNDPMSHEILFTQKHLDTLVAVLLKGTLWCLNIGEIGIIKGLDWSHFIKSLPKPM